MQTKRVRKASRKDQGLLVSVAQSIGSTLGTVAAKADMFSKPTPRRKVATKSRVKTNSIRKKRRA